MKSLGNSLFVIIVFMILGSSCSQTKRLTEGKVLYTGVKKMNIETAKGVRWLSDGLREIAELRLEYPDLPLAELGQKLSKPLGKSGVNHRLRKLSEIAERLRAEQEISLKPKEERS